MVEGLGRILRLGPRIQISATGVRSPFYMVYGLGVDRPAPSVPRLLWSLLYQGWLLELRKFTRVIRSCRSQTGRFWINWLRSSRLRYRFCSESIP